MKLLIVEDSPIYTALLKNKLKEVSVPIEIVGEATDIASAKKMLELLEPEVLILDVDLGGATSFDLFNNTDYKKYQIIFATGHDNFAISAFDIEAIGYLIKPVVASQLEKFMQIAQRNILAKNENISIGNGASESIFKKQPISNETISVPSEEGFDIIPLNKIIRCEAVNSTTHISVASGKTMVSSYNLGKFYDRLEEKGFFAIDGASPCHRSLQGGCASAIGHAQDQGIAAVTIGILHDIFMFT